MRRILPLLVLAGLLVPCGALQAAPVLDYVGSFDLPQASGHGGLNYAEGLAFVPDDRPRLSTVASVAGPSLLVGYTNISYTIEFNQLPTPSTDSGSVPLAAQVGSGTGLGGTEVDTDGLVPNWVDLAGNIWDSYYSPQSSAVGSGMRSDPGTDKYVLGVTARTAGYGLKETTWGGFGYAGSAVMRLGDGLGGDNPKDGTAAGATFVHASRSSSAGDSYALAVTESVRSDATTMVNSELFRLTHSSFVEAAKQMTYARGTDGNEYFIFWKAGGHGGDSWTLTFYDATASGTDPAPVGTYDIGDDIPVGKEGAGWLNASGIVSHVAVDWTNSTLYVQEQRYRDTRIHVFSLVPEPATMGLLGLGFLPLLRRRRLG